jgi:heme oxygenase
VAGVGGFFPDWPQRTRRLALLHVVARLDGTVEPVRVPLLRDAGSVLGVMYVLEGSRLGARVLLKEVLASPDAAVVAATRYLRHGEGENLWPSFLAQLEAHAAALGDDGAAIAGARQAFEMFAQAAERAMQPARRLAPA